MAVTVIVCCCMKEYEHQVFNVKYYVFSQYFNVAGCFSRGRAKDMRLWKT